MQTAGAEMLVAETIRRLARRIDPVVFCLDGVGALGEQLLGEGVEVVVLDRRPGRDWRVAWRLAREVRSRRIQLLHAHQYTPFFYAALAKTLAGGRARLVFTEHGRHYPDVVSRSRRLVNAWVFDRMADAVNGVSAFSTRSLADLDGFSRDRLEVIENGIEVQRYLPCTERRQLRRRLGLDADRRYIAHIARFHPVKDQATLLRAFARIAVVRDGVDLLMVGDGPLRPSLEELARSLGVASRVRFLGVRTDVPDILGCADVFALTSLSEAASLTLLEAMASAVPVVVTAVGGNPEIVRHGIDGLLVPRGDEPAIASAILQILADPSMAEAMGREAAARASSHYRLEQTIERYHDLYSRLVAEPSS
jgi:N-acetyl-alpha-D-glucosaminyl L-malate synthase BshA